MPRLGLPAMAGLIAALLFAPAAYAQSGGTEAPGEVRVTALRCLPIPCAGSRHVMAGAELKVLGRELQASRSVIFRGRRGRADDVAAPARHVGTRHFEVSVPATARSGRLDLVAGGRRVTAARRVRVQPAPVVDEPGADVYFSGDARRPQLSFTAAAAGDVQVQVVREVDGVAVRTLTVQAQAGENRLEWDGRTDTGPAPSGRYALRLAGGAQAAETGATSFSLYDHAFPIRGKHDLGQSATNNFGGARNHKGQDMFAACGTPLVAARSGTVRYAGYHGQAGNYVVITSSETKRDYVYMHLDSTPLVRTGDKVATRQPLGLVGDSGNASGCHLHFELWTAPGWYAGGKALDPLPMLQAWDGWS